MTVARLVKSAAFALELREARSDLLGDLGWARLHRPQRRDSEWPRHWSSLGRAAADQQRHNTS
ncbi:MAG: hypothetical protein ACRDRI_23715 [Pseudonocardiaceae bacterium]